MRQPLGPLVDRIGVAAAQLDDPARLEAIDAPFLLISFNNEGFIPPDRMRATLNRLGTVEVLETRYNAFRGSRNFKHRPIHVTEQLFLVERS